MPSVSIAAFAGAANGEQTTAITLSEASTDFTQSDLTLTNATATLSGSGTSYTAVLTPTTDGEVKLSVAAGTFTDAVGNANTASNEVSNVADLTMPTVSVGAFTGAPNGNQTAAITLSEASTDFTQSDLTLTNSTATLTGSGTSYTAVLTPITDGEVKLSVAAGAFTDSAGNNNSASNETSTLFDGTSPTVSISSTTTSISGPGSFEIAVTFSENVIGFAASDMRIKNGSIQSLTGSGSRYIATVSASGNGTIEASVAANVAKDVAGNSNTASNTISIGNKTIEDTQKVIATFQFSRANQLVSNQPGLIGLLSGAGGGSFDASVTRGLGTFEFASDPSGKVWVKLNGSWGTENTAKIAYAFGAIGTHMSVSPNLLVGAMLQFDHLSQKDALSSVTGTGWLAGPYFVAKLPEHPLYVEGRLLYGETSNTISPFGTYSDQFQSERWLAQLKVAGDLSYGATILRPKVQASYTNDTQRAYVDSLGNTIPSQKIELSQIELGLDFSHFVPLRSSNGTLEFTGGVSAIGSFSQGTGFASSVVPSFKGGRGRINLGANYAMEDGSVLSASGFYDGIGVAGFENYGIQIGIDLTF